MKKIYFVLTGFLVALQVQAQKDFQGMAVYESKTSTSEWTKRMDGNRDITPEMRAQIEERMKKAFEKTFILNFDKTASIYKEEEKLDATPGGQNGFRMMSSMMGGGGTYYKNTKDKSFSVDKEFFGKEFLIKDSLTTLVWEMGTETKKIGDYTCFKATAKKPASTSDFRNFRMRDPKKQEEKKDKKEGSEIKETEKTAEKATTTATKDEPKKEEKSTNFLEQIEMPKEIVITAWYCPEIPVAHGPEGYWGLPGLIMEVSDGNTIILCSKLALNVKDKVKIEAPNNGSKVTQKEYDEIVAKKMKEFADGGGMQGGRGGFRIR